MPVKKEKKEAKKSAQPMLAKASWKTTSEIPVPEKLVDQIIGQEKAVNLIKKAAAQRRNVLLIGSPGTGKSMLAQAMAEIMPIEDLEDVLIYPNANDENNPRVVAVKTRGGRLPIGIPDKSMAQLGQGRRILEEERMKNRMSARGSGPSLALILVGGFLLLLLLLQFTQFFGGNEADAANKMLDCSLTNSTGNSTFTLCVAKGEAARGENIIAAFILGSLILGAGWLFTNSLTKRMGGNFDAVEPKLIVDNTRKTSAPFVDGTGSKAGALFGDVKHDPLQSGGLGTPPHLRVEAGAIHRANKGVLYLDEVSLLTPKSQQDLLTAMQEKKFPITGQSEMSSGALVRSEPVPCDFVLVAAGNLIDVGKMHPALRSRIRGYGYEVFVEENMPDTEENRKKLARFVAQEVKKDMKIPQFTKEAVDEIIEEAKRKAGRKHSLTLKLRELGGIIRAAGDIAKEEKADVVTEQHVLKAKKIAVPLEQQISQQFIEVKKDYQVFTTEGYKIGKVNGLAVLGEGASGLVLPIVAEVTPASSKTQGKLIATGKLGKIAKEAVENVSAIIKKHIGKDVSQYDIHVQFLQTYEGVEGDSASISIAVSVISAMENIPVDQSIAMTGSLSVRGEVLPVGGVTSKIEAAIEGGAKTVIIPFANKDDVYLSEENKKKIRVIPVKTIVEVIQHVLHDHGRKHQLIKDMKTIANRG